MRPEHARWKGGCSGQHAAPRDPEPLEPAPLAAVGTTDLASPREPLLHLIFRKQCTEHSAVASQAVGTTCHYPRLLPSPIYRDRQGQTGTRRPSAQHLPKRLSPSPTLCVTRHDTVDLETSVWDSRHPITLTTNHNRLPKSRAAPALLPPTSCSYLLTACPPGLQRCGRPRPLEAAAGLRPTPT